MKQCKIKTSTCSMLGQIYKFLIMSRFRRDPAFFAQQLLSYDLLYGSSCIFLSELKNSVIFKFNLTVTRKVHPSAVRFRIMKKKANISLIKTKVVILFISKLNSLVHV